jgi:serine/threonine-protein kinase
LGENIVLTPNPDIGRYRLDRRMPGEGNVWLAEDLEEPLTPVVVKFVPEDADIFGYRQQGHALAELEESGLIAPIDSGEAPGGLPFFVFPYAEGRTLRQVLNEDGPMPVRRAAGILKQMGRILAAAHSRQIPHGALDPEHVIIAHAHGRDVVSVINFGSWRLVPQPSTSPAYQAPEHRAGRFTTSADIYSFAAIAAEMLTGRRVFRYGSEQELAKQQRIGVARGALRTLRHEIPPRVEDELRRALAYDPAHRPADAAVFADRIADTLSESPALPLRRILLLAGLLAAVAGGGAYRACRHHSPLTGE